MKFLRRTPLLVAALAAGIASAADSSTGGDLPNLSTATQTQASTTGNTNTAATTGGSTTGGSTGVSTTAAASSTKATTGVSISGGSTDTGTATSIPSITGDASSTDGGALPSGLPTLSGAYKIVPASVPPTQNAPYMQTSTLPEGTVFIVVGAILGFMAMSVLLWRGLVAWSLHRSVKRAAMQQNMSDTKALFRAPPAPFYKYHDRESTISLSGLGGKGGKKGGRPTTAPGVNSTSSLFFSPTAGAVPGGLNNSGNRASSYLPAGYYAAGAAQAGNSQSHVSLGHGPAISLSNLGPQSAGYTRARSMGPSPPDSPSLTASRGHMASSSTLNLTQAGGYAGEQRAPSAYLEDLFDGTNESPAVPSHSPQHRF